MGGVLTGGADDEVSVAVMIPPLRNRSDCAPKEPAEASLMRIAACRAGLTHERNNLRRTWLPGAQKGGLILARVFNKAEACRRILIHAADTLWAVYRGLS